MLSLTRTVVCKGIVIEDLRSKKYRYESCIKELFIYDNAPIKTLRSLLKKMESQLTFLYLERHIVILKNIMKYIILIVIIIERCVM